MKIFSLFFVLLFVCALPVQVRAKDISWLEMRAIGDGFGVQVKESRTSPEELEQIREAGFGFVRYGISWAKVEHEKGVYDWSAYDNFIEEVTKHDLRSIIIIGGGNVLYTKEVAAPKKDVDHRDKIVLPPTKADEIAAFARFAAAAATHYKDHYIIWEIWNEPDLARFWHPKPDAKVFALLATETCAAMRQAEPAVNVIGPASASMPGHAMLWDEPEFTEPLLKSPASDCLDAISFHSYRIDEWDNVKIPESVMEDNKRVQKFVTDNLPSGRQPLALVNTEWGYALTQGKPHSVAVTQEMQTAYVLRTRFANLMSGVPLSIWYEWRDQHVDMTPDASDTEAHFGLMTIDKQEKPSLAALREILPLIRKAKIERQLPTENRDNIVLALVHPDGRYTLAFWTVREPNVNPDILEIKRTFNTKRAAFTSQPQLMDVGSEVPEITITPAASL